MKKILAAAGAAFFSVGVVCAQTSAPVTAPVSTSASSVVAAPGCAAKAIDKNGKPLVGAAKTSFIKKCESDSKGNAAAACETKAVG
ncbi:hypothetical protein SAMN02787142_0636 [Burkholderia sp. WP9]|uniref:hypothetical protein n=1 Tax=Burkholderia sp. WP9 TaxID=1500263 RepID=UPI0008963B4C|nr:hypothetical protein SAMN02787142_0636 [Burkholderia sp. WP9]